jgi:hypothetical protein
MTAWMEDPRLAPDQRAALESYEHEHPGVFTQWEPAMKWLALLETVVLGAPRSDVHRSPTGCVLRSGSGDTAQYRGLRLDRHGEWEVTLQDPPGPSAVEAGAWLDL